MADGFWFRKPVGLICFYLLKLQKHKENKTGFSFSCC